MRRTPPGALTFMTTLSRSGLIAAGLLISGCPRELPSEHSAPPPPVSSASTVQSSGTPRPPAMAPHRARLTPILSFALGRPVDTGALLAELRAAREGASGDERALLDRELDLLEAPGDPRAKFDAASEILRAFGRLFVDDVIAQSTVAATLDALAWEASNVGADGAALKRESVALAQKLVARFPSEARPYGLVGAHCVEAGDDPLTCLRHFARCVELRPPDSFCAHQYRELAERYLAPSCKGAQLKKGFGLYLATPTPRPGTRPVSTASMSLHAETKPAVEASQISLAETSQITVNGTPERALSLKLTDDGARRLSALGHQLAGPWLVIMVGEKVITAVALRALDANPFMISGIGPAEVCATSERRTLPADLPPPASR
jgi:hypothetical protein